MKLNNTRMYYVLLISLLICTGNMVEARSKIKLKNKSQKKIKSKARTNITSRRNHAKFQKKIKGGEPEETGDGETESQRQMQSKRSFNVFQGLRLLAVGSGVFKPLEFFFNRMDKEIDPTDKSDSLSKCGKKAIIDNYVQIIKEGMVKIKAEKLSEPFTKRLDDLVNRCTKFVEENAKQQANIDKEKANKPPDTEVSEGLLSSINDAKESLVTFKSWLSQKTIDLTSVKVSSRQILENIGCNIKDSQELKDCLSGKKDDKGRILNESPIDVVEKLASIQINQTIEKEHPLLKTLEKNQPADCKFLEGFNTVGKDKRVSAFQKMVVRVRALLVAFNEVLKCKGVSKPWMEVFKSIDLAVFESVMINFMTMDTLPSSNFRLRWLVGGVVTQFLNYFDKIKSVKIAEEGKAKAKLQILMSWHLGLGVGYFCRSLLEIFGNKWDDAFRISKKGDQVNVTSNKIDGIAVFDNWNLHVEDKKKRKWKK